MDASNATILCKLTLGTLIRCCCFFAGNEVLCRIDSKQNRVLFKVNSRF